MKPTNTQPQPQKPQTSPPTRPDRPLVIRTGVRAGPSYESLSERRSSRASLPREPASPLVAAMNKPKTTPQPKPQDLAAHFGPIARLRHPHGRARRLRTSSRNPGHRASL